MKGLVSTCPRCQRQLREDMGFCPGCGLNLRPEAEGPAPTMGRAGAIHFQGPAQPVYPMPFMPPPMMYAPPTSPKRAMAIAGGVMMIIAASFIFLGGLVFVLEGWWWADYWVILGVLCFGAFALGITGAVGVFRRTWRYLDLVAAVLLVVTGIVTIFDLEFLAIIVLIMAIISLILVAVSWGQFDEPRGMPYPMYPGFMPPGVPMYPPGMGGAPVGPMGAPSMPQQAPPPLGGAPPPPAYPVPSMDEGAPPPPVRRDLDEDVVVDLEERGPDEV